MLDASGSYRKGVRTSDAITGDFHPISIEKYLEFWNTDEKLTTFTFSLTSRMRQKKLRI